ncbi:hypothetical protein Tsubulata_039459 [Turnera subulata]|uniref:DUF4283 domain-containing protein n=1 Tax=Turnera subulata TaxID=218843 RepID=A0A9Q0F0C5_9ROSI|nr:hypothetical protein Tsubulata_039459 [Turnera subulata]
MDYKNVLLNGPWMVYGHAVYAQPWIDNFRPSSDERKQVVVWIQFQGFPQGRYHSQSLRILGNLVGITVKIDPNTAKSMRGKVLKVVVAIDLSKPRKYFVVLQKEKIRATNTSVAIVRPDQPPTKHAPISPRRQAPHCPNRRWPSLPNLLAIG